ncbi:MAG: bifunctional phosphopantothenoylcysteine decarboxylase/phosphopantothenate--cysteine ligase CoaBC [Spirochaetales bacterium]|nr:bifunctional phosphopantothenoylcysteine decarboxylase/phosphopantothenate--cysteine ligase CoaBC [Spirochaetales bacterium]
MKNCHPSKDITGSIEESGKGKKIVLCITGSVAAVRSPDIARGLMRRGYEVYPVMTAAGCRIIHPDLMHWATGNPAVTELTGALEHVRLAGNVAGKADLILIAPSTANTIGKISSGIDDTPVTTVATTAIGEGIPLVIVPAMHESMYNHPILRENILRLRQMGIDVLDPLVEEGKAKIPDTDAIIQHVITRFSSAGRLESLRVLITAGATIEYIDPVRIITNRSSGKMGMALAAASHLAGADVTVVYGRGTAPLPYGVRVVRVETAAQMQEEVSRRLESKGVDIVIAAAAVGDWTVKKSSDTKIATSGRKTLSLDLVPTPKIIDGIRKKSPEVFLVCFRAVTGLEDEQIIADAFVRLQKADADLIVANDVARKGSGFEGDTNEVFIVDHKRNVLHVGPSSKTEVAVKIIEAINRGLEKRNR